MQAVSKPLSANPTAAINPAPPAPTTMALSFKLAPFLYSADETM